MLPSNCIKKKSILPQKTCDKNYALLSQTLFLISLNPCYTHKNRHFPSFTYRVLATFYLSNPVRGGRQEFKSRSNSKASCSKPHFKSQCPKQKQISQIKKKDKLKREAVTVTMVMKTRHDLLTGQLSPLVAMWEVTREAKDQLHISVWNLLISRWRKKDSPSLNFCFKQF